MEKQREMNHEFYIKRDLYTEQTTLGKLYYIVEKFCETLEDTVRPQGIKVNGHTAIPGSPSGMRYHLSISFSNRFQRDMPIIYNQIDKSTLTTNGISFKGIRMHGGNDHEDTEGCPLVAYNRISNTKIQGTAEKALTAKIKELEKTGECYITIINLSQKS